MAATWEQVEQIVGLLESTIAQKNAEIDALRAQLTANDPAVTGQKLHALHDRISAARLAVHAIEMQIDDGTYTGDGNDSRAVVTSLVFQPDIVLIKGGSNNAVMRTSSMAGDLSKDLADDIALEANLVQSLDSAGFTIGTDARVNANGTVYRWIAFRENTADCASFSYVGNSTDNRDITDAAMAFTPAVVIIMRDGTSLPVFTTTDLVASASAMAFTGGSATTNIIQAFNSPGFQIGTSGTVNTGSSTYHVVAFKNVAGVFETFTYTGNGVDGRDITGFTGTPFFGLTKIDGGSIDTALRFSTHAGDSCSVIDAAADAANRIQSFISTGMDLGTANEVNANTFPYYGFWAAQQLVPPSTGGVPGALMLLGVG